MAYSAYVGDCGNYHGWAMGVDINNPSNVMARATTVMGGGIWGHSGVASDGTNSAIVWVAGVQGDQRLHGYNADTGAVVYARAAQMS